MTFNHVIVHVHLFYSSIHSTINPLSSIDVVFIHYSLYLDGIPPDGTPISVTNTIHDAVIVIYDMIAALGIIFAICCLVFNIVFRNKKLVNRFIKPCHPACTYCVLGWVLCYDSKVF